MSLNPNLDEMNIKLSECHKGHVSIIYPGEECPLCEALEALDKREQELTEVYKDLEKAEESLLSCVKQSKVQFDKLVNA